MEEITILIKTFERKKVLIRAIKSVLKFYPNINIIIGDDSKVSCEEEIKGKFKNKNIKVYNLPYDCGISYGRNFILKKVKTKYFCLMDDDFVFDKKTHLEDALNILKEKNLSIIGGHVRNYKIIKNFKDKIIFLIQKILKYEIPTNYIGKFTLLKKDTLKVEYVVHSFPDYTDTEITLNFFIGVTKDILNNLWDEELKLQEHTAFFYKAKKNKFKIGYTNKLSIRHCPVQNKDYEKKRKRNYSQLFMQKNNLNKIIAIYDDESKNNVIIKDKLKNILVSIIIPVYNGEKYIEETLSSIRKQTYKNLEIIVVDNNSKDNTIEKIKNVQKLDSRIKLLKETLQGPNYARKKGFNESQGEYLFFLDSDDCIEDDTIYNYVKIISETGADYVISDYYEIDTRFGYTKLMQGAPNTKENLKNDKTTMLYKQTLGIKMIKKELIRNEDFVFTKIGEDMVLSKLALARAKNARHLMLPTLNYHLDANGLSSRVEVNHLLERMSTCNLLKELFIKNGFYKKYKQEIDYIMITHPLYSAFKGENLANKAERELLRSETLKYINQIPIKKNNYYKKSAIFKATHYLIKHKHLYHNLIIRNLIIMLFNNKTLNIILKKLDSR